MNGLEFIKSVNQLEPGKLARCFLFTGEDEYIKQQSLAALKKRLLPPGLEEMNESLLTDPTADELIAACETLPFGCEKRIVVVKECRYLSSAQKGEGGREDARIAEYLPKLPREVCLVFYVRGAADSRKVIVKACKAGAGGAAVLVDFAKLDGATLAQWIRQKVREAGKTIGPEEIQILIATVGKDTSLLYQEIGKLTAYLGEKNEVSPEDIRAICTPSMECTVFDMVEAQVSGRLEESFRLLAQLYKNGEDGMMVLAMLLRQYRMLYHLRCLTEEGASQGEVAALVGLPPFILKKIQSQVSRYSKEDLRRAYDQLLDMEYRIKQGKFSQTGCAEAAILFLSHILNQNTGASKK